MRGLFELISGEAAGFYSWWQQEYVSELTASPWAGVCWEARGSLGQDALCRWKCKAPCYQSEAKSRPCWCRTDLEGAQGMGKQVQSSQPGAGGAPARSCAQGRVPAVGSGRDLGLGWFF